MRISTKFLIFPLLLLAAGSLRAQVAMSAMTVEQYVQDVLLGSGIQATNITFTGCPDQVGYLQNGNSVGLGLESGIVLASDLASNITPFPAEDGFLDTFVCPTSGGDPDLFTIANSVPPLIGQNFTVNSINEQAILEFDFVPTGDTLRFRYVFASVEYNGWENSQYNDVFAFFLSGPDITGPYDAPAGFPGGAINIAVVPGSDPALPITISSVNADMNSDYYIDNFDSEGIDARGFTVVLEAVSEVTCGETYHIKLAIADGSDSGLTSYVLLEEGSFSSNAVVDVSLNLNVGGPNATTLYEDCGEAELVFTRAPVSNMEVEDMVVIEWAGTAQMGIDYTEMPDTIIFPIGVNQISFSIDAFVDNITEGEELVTMNILNLGACNGSGLVSNFEFFLNDFPDPLQVDGVNHEICNGVTIALEPVITGGYGNFHYSWSTGQTTPSIDVSPTVDATYFLTVSDTCGMPSDDGQFLVTVLQFPPLEVSITSGDLLLNCNESVDIFADATGGDGAYTFVWTNEDGMNLGGWGNSLFYGSWNGEGEIRVTVTDGCGITALDIVTVELNVPDLIVTAPVNVAANCNVPYTVTVNTSGGEAPYNYSWTLNGTPDWWAFGNTYTFTANQPGLLEVMVGDNCGQVETVEIPFTINSPPVSFDLPGQMIGTCSTVFNIQPANITGSGGYTYLWEVGDGQISSGVNLVTTFPQSTVVGLTITDACSASAQNFVNIVIENPAIILDLGPDIYASCVDETSIIPTISGGSGGFVYTWSVADTLFAATPAIQLQSYATVPVRLEITDNCGSMALDQLTYFIPDIPITFMTSPDTAICRGGLANVFAIAFGGEGGFEYDWVGSSLDTTHLTFRDIYASQNFLVKATDICGKFTTTTVSVVVAPVEAIFTSQEIDTDKYRFTDQSIANDDDLTYTWTIDYEFISDLPEFEHRFDGLGPHVVGLTVENSIGCTDSDEKIIQSAPLVYIPTAFTPNGDGINDAFFIKGGSIRSFNFRVFNRWGDVVFESTDPEKPWIGDFKSGEHYGVNEVYNYTLRAIGFKNEVVEKTGTIQIIR